eukprot:7577472-Alexandrium_andersonii.AAC.1
MAKVEKFKSAPWQALSLSQVLLGPADPAHAHWSGEADAGAKRSRVTHGKPAARQGKWAELHKSFAKSERLNLQGAQ